MRFAKGNRESQGSLNQLSHPVSPYRKDRRETPNLDLAHIEERVSSHRKRQGQRSPGVKRRKGLKMIDVKNHAEYNQNQQRMTDIGFLAQNNKGLEPLAELVASPTGIEDSESMKTYYMTPMQLLSPSNATREENNWDFTAGVQQEIQADQRSHDKHVAAMADKIAAINRLKQINKSEQSSSDSMMQRRLSPPMEMESHNNSFILQPRHKDIVVNGMRDSMHSLMNPTVLDSQQSARQIRPPQIDIPRNVQKHREGSP